MLPRRAATMALEPIPMMWNRERFHIIGKNRLYFKKMEHVLHRKSLTTFPGHALKPSASLSPSCSWPQNFAVFQRKTRLDV